MDEDLIDQVIATAFVNQYIYSKTQFDNAKDTTALLAAADQNRDMMITAAKARLVPYADELLERRIRKVVDEYNGNMCLTLSNGEFVKVKVEVEPQTNGNLVGGVK